MSQNSAQQRKNEILMQIAQERVQLLTSVAGARTHAGACAEALYLNNAVVRKGLLAVSSALAATLSFKAFRKKEATTTPRISTDVSAGRYFSAKLATAVLIPWLRKVMVGGAYESPCKKGGKGRYLSHS